MWQYDNMTMCQCGNVAMWQYGNVAMWQCGNVTKMAKWKCDNRCNVVMWQCGNVIMWECDDVAKWQYGNVAMWQCWNAIMLQNFLCWYFFWPALLTAVFGKHVVHKPNTCTVCVKENQDYLPPGPKNHGLWLRHTSTMRRQKKNSWKKPHQLAKTIIE